MDRSSSPGMSWHLREGRSWYSRRRRPQHAVERSVLSQTATIERFWKECYTELSEAWVLLGMGVIGFVGLVGVRREEAVARRRRVVGEKY